MILFDPTSWIRTFKERIYPRVRSYIQSAERRRERISEQHRTPLERYVTYPVYKKLTGFGERWRGGMERWEGVPRIREKIWETPVIREWASFGTGVARSPAVTAEFAAQIPTGIEYAIREPKLFRESVPVGGAIMTKETIQAFKERPFETTGEFVGAAALSHGLGKTIKIPKPRAKIKIPKERVIPKTEYEIVREVEIYGAKGVPREEIITEKGVRTLPEIEPRAKVRLKTEVVPESAITDIERVRYEAAPKRTVLPIEFERITKKPILDISHEKGTGILFIEKIEPSERMIGEGVRAPRKLRQYRYELIAEPEDIIKIDEGMGESITRAKISEMEAMPDMTKILEKIRRQTALREREFARVEAEQLKGKVIEEEPESFTIKRITEGTKEATEAAERLSRLEKGLSKGAKIKTKPLSELEAEILSEEEVKPPAQPSAPKKIVKTASEIIKEADKDVARTGEQITVSTEGVADVLKKVGEETKSRIETRGVPQRILRKRKRLKREVYYEEMKAPREYYEARGIVLPRTPGPVPVVEPVIESRRIAEEALKDVFKVDTTIMNITKEAEKKGTKEKPITEERPITEPIIEEGIKEEERFEEEERIKEQQKEKATQKERLKLKIAVEERIRTRERAVVRPKRKKRAKKWKPIEKELEEIYRERKYPTLTPEEILKL